MILYVKTNIYKYSVLYLYEILQSVLFKVVKKEGYVIKTRIVDVIYKCFVKRSTIVSAIFTNFGNFLHLNDRA